MIDILLPQETWEVKECVKYIKNEIWRQGFPRS